MRKKELNGKILIFSVSGTKNIFFFKMNSFESTEVLGKHKVKEEMAVLKSPSEFGLELNLSKISAIVIFLPIIFQILNLSLELEINSNQKVT